MASKRACFSFLYYISHDDVDNWANIVHGCRQGSMCFVHYHRNNQWCEVCTPTMPAYISEKDDPILQPMFDTCYISDEDCGLSRHGKFEHNGERWEAVYLRHRDTSDVFCSVYVMGDFKDAVEFFKVKCIRS